MQGGQGPGARGQGPGARVEAEVRVRVRVRVWVRDWTDKSGHRAGRGGGDNRWMPHICRAAEPVPGWSENLLPPHPSSCTKGSRYSTLPHFYRHNMVQFYSQLLPYLVRCWNCSSTRMASRCDAAVRSILSVSIARSKVPISTA